MTGTTGLVVVAEDDPAVASLLRLYLGRDGFGVETYADGSVALQAIQSHHPVAVVLDIGLQGLDGIEVCRQIRTFSDCYILILTARGDEVDRLIGLSVGADDYLTKPFSLPELEARVRALLRRGQCGANPLVTYGALSFDSVERHFMLNDERLELTARELGVLEALMSRAGRVVSKEKLIEHLYSHNEEASSNAIEVYVHRVRKKIEAAGVTIRTVRGLGYLMDKI